MQRKKIERLGEEKLNYQNCLMRIVEYNNANDMFVEFDDKHKSKVHARYENFKKGNIKNPYFPSLFGVGIVGNKYTYCINGNYTKEGRAWEHMMERCFNKNYKDVRPTYNDVTCCDDWIYFDKFYEWLHIQDNFSKWYNGEKWALDKDILFKGNKIYSPETCCLVPASVNSLFVKCDSVRGDLPVGVHSDSNKFSASCQNPFTKQQEYLGSYNTANEAFNVYKEYKEDIIKKVAQIEFNSGNIIKECYNAMMEYEVEITD